MSLLQRRMMLGQEDENMERGTFVGDGTGEVTIPVSSKKSNIALKCLDASEEDVINAKFETNGAVLQGLVTEELGMLFLHYLTSGDTNVTNTRVSRYSASVKVEFGENEIYWKHYLRPFLNGITYEWVAW